MNGVILNSYPIISIELGDKNKFRKEILNYMKTHGYNTILHIPEDKFLKKVSRLIFNIPYRFVEITRDEILTSNKNYYLLLFINKEKNNDFKF